MAKKRRSRGSGGVIKLASGFYAYQYIDAAGIRKTKSLRTKNKTEAVEAAEAFTRIQQAKDKETVVREIARSRDIIRTRELPLSDTWAAFMDSKPTAGAGTLKNYERALRDLCDWLTAEQPTIESFTQVDHDTAGAYLEHLHNTGISGNTYNYRRNALGHITKKLAGKYRIDVNPWELTERKAEVKQRRRALNSIQVTAFLELIDTDQGALAHRAEMRAVALLGLYAGLRLKDACLIRWRNIDLAAGRLEYEPAKTVSKGKTAVVPILPPLADALRALAPGEPQDFALPKIAELYERNPDGVQKPLLALLHTVTGDIRQSSGTQRKVQRSTYGLHSLRHTFACMAAMAGAAPAYLAAMLGDNIATVDRYYVRVGLGAELVEGFAGLPKMIEAKAVNDPDRAALHRLADEADLATIRRLLKLAGPALNNA